MSIAYRRHVLFPPIRSGNKLCGHSGAIERACDTGGGNKPSRSAADHRALRRASNQARDVARDPRARCPGWQAPPHPVAKSARSPVSFALESV